VQNLFYATAENGVAAMVYAPSKVKVLVAYGVNVAIEEITNYPFEDEIIFNVNPEQTTEFAFELRIPRWCDNPKLTINGVEITVNPQKGMVKINRTWHKKDILKLQLPMEIKTSRWFEKSVAIQRGPLLYALKIKEDWQEKKQEPWSNSYFEVYPKSDWNYGITKKSLDNKNFTFKTNQVVTDMPWNLENAPSSIITIAKRIPYWTEYNGSSGRIPVPSGQQKPTGTEEEKIELIPYGCTTLRISQFPVIFN